MVVSSNVASLAMSVLSGALKLGKRLDEIGAEEEAVLTPLALRFETLVGLPRVKPMKAALEQLLLDRSDLTRTDKEAIDRALAGDAGPLGSNKQTLFQLCEKHELAVALQLETFAPDARFEEELRKRSANWSLSEPDIKRFTYFVAAGRDLRQGSLEFRIAAAVIDVVAEVGAQNTRFLTDHEPTRALLESVLTKFSEPDLAAMGSWSAVLQQAVRATMNAAIDHRAAIARNEKWLGRALSALASARETAGDDFVMGLLNGSGFDAVVHGILTEAASSLSEGDEEIWESIVSDVLVEAAKHAKGSRSFELFFRENWHALIGAGLTSVQAHGPKLLNEDDEVLKSVLTATVGALAESFRQGPPDVDTLNAAVKAAAGVFADPALLDGKVAEEWLRELLASVAGTVRDKGLRKAFSEGALQDYARSALEIFSRYPEFIAGDSALVQKILSEVLGDMAAADSFALGDLADVTVQGTFEAIAANPELVNGEYASVIGDLAGNLATRVANGGLDTLPANALIESITEVVATNEFLFLKTRNDLAAAVVDAVLDAAEEDDNSLLVGSALVVTVQRTLEVTASVGLGFTGNAQAIQARVHEVLLAALTQASSAIGQEMAQSDVPEVLVAVVEKLASGEPFPELGSPDFKSFFLDLFKELRGELPVLSTADA